ncbi:MAG: sigma-54-dependent Fis family transcriptional regulator [Candidatus Latescibacteria bacterium]|nr:sigma-54-dependent Fis family transcriptional regulator [Candidatus Latescibacterota bacterium]
MSATLLIVDDEEKARRLLEDFFTNEGYRVTLASSGKEGLERFVETVPDLVLLDIRLPDMDGIEVLEELKRLNRECPVVMATGYASVASAIKAMKLGAEDYIIKPFHLHELKITVGRALEKPAASHPAESSTVKGKSGFDNIIGDSPEIKSVLATVSRIAKVGSATTLIRGESGTGKELIARALHFNSPRSDHPFVEVNCTAIPETLLEDELFGHEKGAYTDARTQRRGLLELADGGTLFLDEVGHTNQALQVKLLHVLETQAFRRLGGTKDIQVSTRIVAATNRDLEKAMQDSSFREDLYYRLNVISIYLPPLRERGDDVIQIAEHYIDRYNREYDRDIRGLSPESEAILKQYHWPGNVRELKNAIERAILLGDEDIVQPKDLLIDWRSKEHTTQVAKPTVEITVTGDVRVAFPPGGISIEAVEKKLIEQALTVTRWNTTKAAQLLHLSRDTLRYRIKKYDLGFMG